MAFELFNKESVNLKIPGPCGFLEARGIAGSEQGLLSQKNYLAVICHPHPVHGGTMDNKVVTTLARTYRDLGINNVSFNFRGVGGSDGEYDNGIGEVDDLLAVIDYLKHRNLDSEQPAFTLLLAGFSFGSAIAAQSSYKVTDLQHLTLVAPAVHKYPYATDNTFPCDICVVQGGEDEVVEASEVRKWSQSLNNSVDFIYFDEATHFFHGALTAFKRQLTEVLSKRLT